MARLPRLLLLLVVALGAAQLAVGTAVGDSQAQQLHGLVEPQAPELQVSASEQGLAVTGLRFRGCPHRSLRVLLLDGAQADAAAASISDGALPTGAHALDFDRTFDRASDSWTLAVALPAGAPRPARLDLLCHACRAGDERLSGLLASRPLGGAQQGGSVVAVVLDGATLPADAPFAGGGASRRLQAADCSLTVAGKAYSFDTCADVKHPNLSNGLSLKVFATVEAAGGGSRLRMALSAPGSQERVSMGTGGWVSVGLPARPGGGMAGASAAVAFPAGKGAEVAGYKLPSDVLDFFPETVNKAKGTFKLGDTAAELADGELRAVFTIDRPDVPASAGQLDYIFAMGPMGDSVPGLDDHTLYGDPYGEGKLALKLASEPSPSPSPKPSPVPSPKPSPSPAPEGVPPPVPSLSPKRVPSPAAAPLPAAAQPASAPAPAVVDDAQVPAAGVESRCALQLGGANAAPQAFSGCSMVQGIGEEYWLMWREEAAPANSGKRLLTIGLNASAPSSSYVSVGFPAQPGEMVGASAVVLAACARCSATGASIEQYYLGGTTVSSVQPGGQLSITNLQAAKLDSGHLVGSFQLELDGTAAGTAGRRLLQLVDGLGLPLIFATGPAAADGTPRRHTHDGYATLPLLDSAAVGAALGDGAVSEETSDDNTSLRAAHAWLAAIGWGVFIPVGIVMARSFQDLEPAWFHLHRALQTLGFIMGCVALGLGFALTGEWKAEDSHLAVHRNLGVACTVLGATQFSAVILRPSPTHKYRFAWRLWHAWVGRAAAVIAIANIYYGTIHIWDLGAWPWASYTAVLGAIVAASLGKDTSDWLRRRRQAKGTGSAGATADATVQLAVPGRKSVDLPAAAAGGAAGDVEAGAGGVGGRGGARTVRVSAGSEVRCTDSPHSTSRVPLKEGFKPDSAQ